MKTQNKTAAISRRQFFKAGALGGAAFAARSAFGQGGNPDTRPNFLLVITDQQGLDTLSALGCADVHTPNMDRLARSGVSFMQSHSTNPLCSPARSSLFTSRPTLETGVLVNELPIRESIPNLGQWLCQSGYETLYLGKWHLPDGLARDIKGFTVIPTSLGTVGDRTVSRAAQGYLLNRSRGKPFFLVTSFLQPHDIGEYVHMHRAGHPFPYPGIVGDLPPLPPNFTFDEQSELPSVKGTRRYQKVRWSEEQWRYYLWSYYQMVEEADADVGRVLDVLEDSGERDNTIVVFTADHGEGRARHQLTMKNFLYDEAVKVPLIFSCPGRMNRDVRDESHLVSGLDVMPTICDCAGVRPPDVVRGKSLRRILEGKPVEWHEFVAAEVKTCGRIIRTQGFKYITFKDDPAEQLFDMKSDPWETKNLAADSAHAAVLEAHRKLLAEWEAGLDIPKNVVEKVQEMIDRAKKKPLRGK